MTYCELNHWLRLQIAVPNRLQAVCFGLILFLMIGALVTQTVKKLWQKECDS